MCLNVKKDMCSHPGAQIPNTQKVSVRVPIKSSLFSYRRRHPRVCGDPFCNNKDLSIHRWIPAYARMTRGILWCRVYDVIIRIIHVFDRDFLSNHAHFTFCD